jgi:hypothetical protein
VNCRPTTKSKTDRLEVLNAEGHGVEEWIGEQAALLLAGWIGEHAALLLAE